MIKFKHKSRWKPAPEGIHNAVVVDVVGDGSAVGAGPSGCEEIRVVWEIEATQSNGRRFTVTKIYPGANAFTQDFEAVLPADHPLVTGDTENVESIIGTPARVDLVHNRKRDGDTFSHVQHQFPAGRTALKASVHYTRLKDRCPSNVQPLTQPKPGIPFDESEVICAAA